MPENSHAPCANHHIQDQEILELGQIEIKAIATPGHTDSHMALMEAKKLKVENVIF